MCDSLSSLNIQFVLRLDGSTDRWTDGVHKQLNDFLHFYLVRVEVLREINLMSRLYALVER